MMPRTSHRPPGGAPGAGIARSRSGAAIARSRCGAGAGTGGGAAWGAVTGPPPSGHVALRLLQAFLAALAALDAIDSAGDFASRYFVSAASVQFLWSLALAILYFYALLVGRSFRSARAVAILGVGDWITGTLTFTASCSSAGIAVLIKHNMEFRYVNQCSSFAITMAFLSWFAVAPCCVYHLSAVVYKLQRL